MNLNSAFSQVLFRSDCELNTFFFISVFTPVKNVVMQRHPD